MVELLSDFTLIKEGLDILKGKGNLTQMDIEQFIRNKSRLTGSTIPRRAASLVSWFKWMSEVTGSFVFEESIFKLK